MGLPFWDNLSDFEFETNSWGHLSTEVTDGDLEALLKKNSPAVGLKPTLDGPSGPVGNPSPKAAIINVRIIINALQFV